MTQSVMINLHPLLPKVVTGFVVFLKAIPSVKGAKSKSIRVHVLEKQLKKWEWRGRDKH